MRLLDDHKKRPSDEGRFYGGGVSEGNASGDGA